MSIFRRGEIWYASYSLPGGKRIKESLGTADKRQAQELHDKRKAELWRVDRLGDFPEVTFEEACLRWLEEKADKKSLDTDKGRMGFWLEHFEGVTLKDITEAKIYAAVSRMQNRKAKEIWQQRVDAAKRKGKEAPAFEAKPVTTSTKAKHLALMKAMATGLRRSNIINLEWQQIDMQRRVAWVNPEDSKSNRAIGVALNDTACKVLRDQIGNHHKWVFVHTKAWHRPDRSLTPSVRKMRVDDNRAWNSACKRAGIEDFRFHDLRHTWASWLIQSGVPLSVLQEMGGWESIEMVRRYAHLAPNHLTEHARQIDSIFAEDVPNMSHKENSVAGGS